MVIRPLALKLGTSKRRAAQIGGAVLLLGAASALWFYVTGRSDQLSSQPKSAMRPPLMKILGRMSIVAVGDVAPRATLLWNDVQPLSSLIKNVDAMIGRDFLFQTTTARSTRPGSSHDRLIDSRQQEYRSIV